MSFPPYMSGVQLALRASVAAAIAIAIADLCRLEFPIYALLAAVLVTDLAPSQSRKLATHRLLATLLGAVCGAALTFVLPPGPIAIGVSILIAMLLCQLLRIPDAAKVAGFICGIVVLEYSAAPWVSAFQRFIETTMGVVVALVVSYVPKLIKIEEPKEQQET